jgi:hypothetical protein
MAAERKEREESMERFLTWEAEEQERQEAEETRLRNQIFPRRAYFGGPILRDDEHGSSPKMFIDSFGFCGIRRDSLSLR